MSSTTPTTKSAAAVNERVLIDTNVLVMAYDAERNGHLAARTLIESDPRDVAVTHQNLREFLNVMTRPREQNGYGLSGAEANAVWADHTATLTFLSERSDSQRRLQGLVSSGLALGKQVHDANLAAVALDHGATAIVTDNARHFERFTHLIAIETLL